MVTLILWLIVLLLVAWKLSLRECGSTGIYLGHVSRDQVPPYSVVGRLNDGDVDIPYRAGPQSLVELVEIEVLELQGNQLIEPHGAQAGLMCSLTMFS